MFFPNYSATFGYLPLRFFITVRTPNKLNTLKKCGKSSKIKKNLNHIGVFIGALLVFGKNSCSLPAKL